MSSPDRLEAGHWVDAGLRVLGEMGIQAVRIESLARTLGVTKGSFYWHFADGDALLREMLNLWRRRATINVVERLDKRGGSAMSRLEGLLQFPFASPKAPEGVGIELAIRLWGKWDPSARAMLAEVDELRLRYIAAIFRDLGFVRDQAEVRASLIYAFMRVGSTLPLTQPATLLAKIVREVVTVAP